MRKMSLFWKTWIVTFCSLILTGCIFVLSYSYLAQRSYEQEQAEKLVEYQQTIYDEISANGIQREILAKYPLQGCFVNVSEGEQLIYPAEGEGFLFQTDTSYFLEDLDVIGGDSSEHLSQEMHVEYGEHVYTVTLMMPKVAYSYSAFGDFVPAFVLVGLIATGMISFLYSLYFSRRIKKLNEKMQAMSNMEYCVEEKQLKGDELVELEMHLNEMYLRLQKVLEDRVFFTRGATHELKTPIMATTSMLEGMIWKVEGFEDRDYYLQECYLQMESMTKLVNEILNLSQATQLQEGTTEFYREMKDLISRYEIIAQDSGCKISFVCDDKNMKVKMREENFKKVLSNLLSNALKYAPENSTIRISMEGRMFTISNECMGLEQDNVAKLCEPFVQGANARDGHGLGLYLVKTILNSSGVEIECLIENGVFIVRFRI